MYGNEISSQSYFNEKIKIVSTAKKKINNLDDLLYSVSNCSNIFFEALTGRARASNKVTESKAAFCVLAKKYFPKISHEIIGEKVSRSHCTVTHYLGLEYSEIETIKKKVLKKYYF